MSSNQQATLWDEFKRPGNYDICARYHGNASTSVEANPSQHSKQKAHATILAALQSAGEATCQRLESLTGLAHESCSARCSELLRDGKITIVGRGVTRSGKPARLYRAV